MWLRLGEKITVLRHSKRDRHFQPVLHELNIPFKRPHAHFKLLRHRRAVRILLMLNLPMNLHHPFQRRPPIPMRPQIAPSGLPALFLFVPNEASRLPLQLKVLFTPATLSYRKGSCIGLLQKHGRKNSIAHFTSPGRIAGGKQY
jgi:hypothetical protein